jgi:hypothetical protein
VWALNFSGVVETLCSCAGHPFTYPADIRSSRESYVLLHVLDQEGWRALAIEIAEAIRALPYVTLTLTFTHEAQMRLEVPAEFAPLVRRALLDASLDAAASAAGETHRRSPSSGFAGD